MKYYGVTQSHCGHEYRWIFTKEEIERNIGEFEDDEYLDVHYPMGGSNSSATHFLPLENDEQVFAFMTGEAEGPDLEDPMLVDIAEYLMTVDTDCGSCTQEFLEKFGLNKKDLEQFDDCYSHRIESERMIAEMLQYEENLPSLASYKAIDRDNPFYGESSDMRYSELCEMYEEFTLKKEEWDKEKEERDI